MFLKWSYMLDKFSNRPMWMKIIVGELFFMFFIIIAFGNMLGNILRTWCEHFMNTKIQKNQIV